MKTGNRMKGGSRRYVRRKVSNELAEKIKRGELYTGVMKVQLDLGLKSLLRNENSQKVMTKIGDEIIID